MRIVVAACTVDYAGRLSASLPEACRLLLVKADGSVLVHADSGGYKPLNWMTGPCALLDGGDVWEVTNAKGERLTVTSITNNVDPAQTLNVSVRGVNGYAAAHPSGTKVRLWDPAIVAL